MKKLFAVALGVLTALKWMHRGTLYYVASVASFTHGTLALNENRDRPHSPAFLRPPVGP